MTLERQFSESVLDQKNLIEFWEEVLSLWRLQVRTQTYKELFLE